MFFGIINALINGCQEFHWNVIKLLNIIELMAFVYRNQVEHKPDVNPAPSKVYAMQTTTTRTARPGNTPPPPHPSIRPVLAGYGTLAKHQAQQTTHSRPSRNRKSPSQSARRSTSSTPQFKQPPSSQAPPGSRGNGNRNLVLGPSISCAMQHLRADCGCEGEDSQPE